MDREKILFELGDIRGKLILYAKNESCPDDIGFKTTFLEAGDVIEFVLANEKEIETYELFIFLRNLVVLKEVQNLKRSKDERVRDLEYSEISLAQEKTVLSALYGYGEKKDREENRSQDVDMKVEDSFASLKTALEELEEITLECSRNYTLYRADLEKLGFKSHDEEIYSTVAMWSGASSSLAETLMTGNSAKSLDYSIKFLKNATVLTKMLNVALSSKDEFTLRRTMNALEQNLATMETYYADVIKVNKMS